jgi:hypothetical protein
MAATLAHIEREELCEKLRRGDDFVLVEALSPMSYALSRLPGAIELGYRNVRHFADGKRAWVEAGLPLETGRASVVRGK